MKNTSDLLVKINNINTKNKCLSCLYMKSLYSNIPLCKCIKRLEKQGTNSSVYIFVCELLSFAGGYRRFFLLSIDLMATFFVSLSSY